MATLLGRRFDYGRWVSFLVLAVAFTVALGAISIGAVYAAGALYLPLFYYPSAIANEVIVWIFSLVYLFGISGGVTALTVERPYWVAILVFVAVSFAGSALIHIIMRVLGFEFHIDMP